MALVVGVSDANAPSVTSALPWGSPALEALHNAPINERAKYSESVPLTQQKRITIRNFIRNFVS
jgi:hypothetical protein